MQERPSQLEIVLRDRSTCPPLTPLTMLRNSAGAQSIQTPRLHKSNQSDRVILVPGPEPEIEMVPAITEVRKRPFIIGSTLLPSVSALCPTDPPDRRFPLEPLLSVLPAACSSSSLPLLEHPIPGGSVRVKSCLVASYYIGSTGEDHFGVVVGWTA